MRKSKFLLSLIAAAAISLSVFGCESSSTGAIQDTTDRIAEADGGVVGLWKEYMIVGQRGLDLPNTFSPGGSQSLPGDHTGGFVVGATSDGEGVDEALLYELFGIYDTPHSDAMFLQPGGESVTPNSTRDVESGLEDVAGFHEVYVDPSGSYMIGLSRSKNRGGVGDPIAFSHMRVLALDFEESIVENWETPNLIFTNIADPIDLRTFAPDQGEFVAGLWSPNSDFFYLAVDGAIHTYTFNTNNGRMDFVNSVGFSANGNPAELISVRDGKYVFGLDNANRQIVRYERDADSGLLTNLGTTMTVDDPRDVTIDRNGEFLYVLGRNPGELAAYRVSDDGNLAPISVFNGLPPVPAVFGGALGGIDADPTSDRIYLALYSGLLQGYTIDQDTGALEAQGTASYLLNASSNTVRVKVDLTGKFVLTVQEHDYEWPEGSAVGYANLNSATNSGAGGVLSLTPQTDAEGRVVYAMSRDFANAFTGDVQAFRIEEGGNLRAERRTEDLENPFGIELFVKFIPAQDTWTPDIN